MLILLGLHCLDEESLLLGNEGKLVAKDEYLTGVEIVGDVIDVGKKALYVLSLKLVILTQLSLLKVVTL